MEVEYYATGMGPTNEEMFERIHPGKNYEKLIIENAKQMHQTYAVGQYRIQQQVEQQEKANAVEQRDVFKVNGKVVASINYNGNLSINPPMLAIESGEKGLSRSAGDNLSQLVVGSIHNSVDANEVYSILKAEFGDTVKAESFFQGEGPTRGELNDLRKQQIDEYLSSLDI